MEIFLFPGRSPPVEVNNNSGVSSQSELSNENINLPSGIATSSLAGGQSVVIPTEMPVMLFSDNQVISPQNTPSQPYIRDAERAGELPELSKEDLDECLEQVLSRPLQQEDILGANWFFERNLQDGTTKLMYEITHFGRVSVVKLIIVKCLRECPEYLDVVSYAGETALSLAVKKNLPQCVEELIKAGCKSEWKSCDREGHGLVHLVASEGDSHVRVLEVLIQHLPNFMEEANCLNDEGLVPLHIAVRKHNEPLNSARQRTTLRIISMLIKNGAKPYVADRASGENIVHYAVRKEDLHILEVILSFSNAEDEKIACNTKNLACGSTPLHMACQLRRNNSERMKIVEILLQHGADNTVVDRQRRRPESYLTNQDLR